MKQKGRNNHQGLVRQREEIRTQLQLTECAFEEMQAEDTFDHALDVLLARWDELKEQLSKLNRILELTGASWTMGP